MQEFSENFISILTKDLKNGIKCIEENIECIKSHGTLIWECNSKLKEKSKIVYEEIIAREQQAIQRKAKLDSETIEQNTLFEELEKKIEESMKINEELYILFRMHKYKELEEENARLSEMLNEKKFQLIQKTSEFNESELTVYQGNIAIQSLIEEILLMESKLPDLETKENDLDHQISAKTGLISEMTEKNLSLDHELQIINGEIQKYQDSIPKLMSDYQDLLKQVNVLSENQGIF